MVADLPADTSPWLRDPNNFRKQKLMKRGEIFDITRGFILFANAVRWGGDSQVDCRIANLLEQIHAVALIERVPIAGREGGI
jgi:hypothetical protein